MSINPVAGAGPAPADPPYSATSLAAARTRVRRLRQDGGTRLRLRALHVMGHGAARIARALGVREITIQDLVSGDARTVSVKLRDAIADLYDGWWDRRAPERTRSERTATAAARRRAIAGDWCAAAALDDDQLDIPGYRPSQGWKPATGTGTAPDIRPRARRHRKPRRGQAGHDAVTLDDRDVSTVMVALDIAADYMRDRAELCADCADQSRARHAKPGFGTPVHTTAGCQSLRSAADVDRALRPGLRRCCRVAARRVCVAC